MKTLKILFVLLISLSILSTACKKDADTTIPDGNYKGSFSVNINGTTYNTLKSDVVEMEEGVTFYASNNNGGQFQIAIPNIPAVGATATLSFDAPDDATMVILASGPIDGFTTLIGGAGTVYHESTENYVLENIVLFGGSGFAEEFPMNGTITVGNHGTK